MGAKGATSLMYLSQLHPYHYLSWSVSGAPLPRGFLSSAVTNNSTGSHSYQQSSVCQSLPLTVQFYV